MSKLPLNRSGLAFLVLAALLAVSPASAHTPLLDWDVKDWCLGAFPNTYVGGGRFEDSAATLFCGRCSVGQRACLNDSDCLAGQTCIEPGSKIETVWWDNRTDAAVNDLATIATTQDDTSLYFVLEQWVSPDPVSIPFFEIGIDFQPGGIGAWHDPLGLLTNPGHCGVSVDRACAAEADCHFCTVSTEEPPSMRPRTCGSGCDPFIPGDVCDTSQTCVDLGSQGPLPAVGVNAAPRSLPDYLLILDLSRRLLGVGDSIQLMKAVGGTWSPVATFDLPSNVGIPGESTIPASVIEFEVPWSAFGCAGCPLACDCTDFGPGQEFRFSGMTSRGLLTLDFSPDGPIEDVLSEAVAGTTTTTTDSCPGFGTTTTTCELADQSQDAFVLAGEPASGGRVDGLVMAKNVGPSIQLNWNPSCSAADVDYQVYEGQIGDFSSHFPVPVLCTTGGATTAVLPTVPGNVYYLIVPTDGSTEGSYGEDGDGFERLGSAAPCRPQSLGDCPIPTFLLSDFEQIRTTLDGVNVFFSDWGSFDLTFIGAEQIRYFNLVADGAWRVRNLPILSTEGDGVVQTQTINFRVLPDDVSPSSPVGSVDLSATLTFQTQATAPNSPVVDPFFSLRIVLIDSGEQGQSLAHTTARTVVGGSATEWAFNGPLPNQDVGAGECAPGAISNSLIFLNEAHLLNIPDNEISIDATKIATGWSAGGAPLSPTPWWDLKQAALNADPMIPVTTITTQSFDQAIAALHDDCDVEFRAPGHVAVVRGLIKLANGNRGVVIQHDTHQGWIGGTKREIVIFDATDGTLLSGWGFDGKLFDRFIIECPE